MERKQQKHRILFQDIFGLFEVDAGPLKGQLGLSQVHQLLSVVTQPDLVLVGPPQLLDVLLGVAVLLSFRSQQAVGATYVVWRLVDRDQKRVQLGQQLLHFSSI